MRTLRRDLLSVIAILLLAFSHPAKAQTSVYGTIGFSDYGYTFNSYGDNFYGDYPSFGGGLTYIFLQRAVTLGVDLRDTYTANSLHGGETGAISLRAGFVPAPHPCHPYVQLGGGFISAKVPASSYTVGAQTINTGSVSIAVGLDVDINRSLSIRAIEIESTVGTKSYPSAATASFSSGIVYHFPNSKKS